MDNTADVDNVRAVRDRTAAPEPWIDVTADCVVEEQADARAGLRDGVAGTAVLQVYPGYRLRKISVNESEDSVFHRITTAFIVERGDGPDARVVPQP